MSLSKKRMSIGLTVLATFLLLTGKHDASAAPRSADYPFGGCVLTSAECQLYQGEEKRVLGINVGTAWIAIGGTSTTHNNVTGVDTENVWIDFSAYCNSQIGGQYELPSEPGYRQICAVKWCTYIADPSACLKVAGIQ